MAVHFVMQSKSVTLTTPTDAPPPAAAVTLLHACEEDQEPVATPASTVLGLEATLAFVGAEQGCSNHEACPHALIDLHR